MTPFGKSVARELGSAKGVVETVSILDHAHLTRACEALVTNALFYVRVTPAMAAARAAIFADAEALASAIADLGVHPEGTSPAIKAARARALVSFDVLIAAVGDAEVTPLGHVLGVA